MRFVTLYKDAICHPELVEGSPSKTPDKRDVSTGSDNLNRGKCNLLPFISCVIGNDAIVAFSQPGKHFNAGKSPVFAHKDSKWKDPFYFIGIKPY